MPNQNRIPPRPVQPGGAPNVGQGVAAAAGGQNVLPPLPKNPAFPGGAPHGPAPVTPQTAAMAANMESQLQAQQPKQQPLGANPPQRMGIAKPAAEVISSNAPALPEGHPLAPVQRSRSGLSGVVANTSGVKKQLGLQKIADAHKKYAEMMGGSGNPVPFPRMAR